MTMIWEHVDEDGDRVKLVEVNRQYALVSRENGNTAVVNLDEDALFRLQDEIERIRRCP